MADTESASAILAETGKVTIDAAHEPALSNGGNGTMEKADQAVVAEAESEDATSGPVNGSATNGQEEKIDSLVTAHDKKRKYEEQDWRERREQDNRRDREDGGRRRYDGGDRQRGRGRGRGGFRGERKNYSDNIRTTYNELPESSDHDEIRKQVEFYFSDSNLPTDRFLLQQVGGSSNNPVPVKVIHSFKRMRHFQPYSAVVAALRDSSTLNIVGDEGNEEIQRKTALPDGTTADPEDNVTLFEDVTRSRSIYAKGFGDEGPNTQFDIEAFFAPYGPTNAIRLRRTYPEKQFKGSVFVEFDCDDTARQFLELENKPKWEGKELKIISKEQYVREKAQDVKHDRIPSNSRARGRGRGDRGRIRGGRGGRDRDGRGGKRERRRSPSRSGSDSRSRSRSPYRREASDSEREDSKSAPPSAVKPEAIDGANGLTGASDDAEAASKKREREDGDAAGEDAQGEGKKFKAEP